MSRPGHRATPNEREWAQHYARLVERFEARRSDAAATAEKKAATQRLVDNFHGAPPA
jgi:hypothetical protein